VSIDLTAPAYSATVDAELTNVMGGTLVKVMAWYDNEMGFHTACSTWRFTWETSDGAEKRAAYQIPRRS
jgi:glyceraldehyde-3-phosphate dehydrogenase/erythrose-4-phosphate dehydrogenase